ncbi:unnamed protein product [Meganyctiphanes norvegica]|uniref:Uncharacterized protein n=1 Tax=Meganyctiphanes norvegica TaxID=48144 RepID=A0AAV2Q1S7_MEGNR
MCDQLHLEEMEGPAPLTMKIRLLGGENMGDWIDGHEEEILNEADRVYQETRTKGPNILRASTVVRLLSAHRLMQLTKLIQRFVHKKRGYNLHPSELMGSLLPILLIKKVTEWTGKSPQRAWMLLQRLPSHPETTKHDRVIRDNLRSSTPGR